jgi:uncharacterized membrane protein
MELGHQVATRAHIIKRRRTSICVGTARKKLTAQKKGIEIKSQGLLLIGIVLLLTGLVASFYKEGPVGEQPFSPYQSIGIALVLVGMLCVVLGFFYPLSGGRETRQKELGVVSKPSE